MVNDEILGGMEAAILRGQTLHKAMLSFYNAGYSKSEIEEAARQIQKTFAFPGKNASIKQPKIDRSGGITKEKNAKQVVSTRMQNKDQMQVVPTRPTVKVPKKPIPKKSIGMAKPGPAKQVVSTYQTDSGEAKELKSVLTDAIEKLAKLKLPGSNASKVGPAPKAPIIVQKVSGYGMQAPKQISKALTFMLIFILILLLCMLGALFFFKEEIIELFNNLSII